MKLTRIHKEKLLNQKSLTIWLYGLSGSGKTTIAIELENVLHDYGFLTTILDGDDVRTGINKDLGFSIEDRGENLRRIAEINKLFNQSGIITINCFITPLIINRTMVREIIGDENFVEVFINTPLVECEKRDVKGLYKKARAGEIKDFTGIDSPFEESNNSITVSTINNTPEDNVMEILSQISDKLHY